MIDDVLALSLRLILSYDWGENVLLTPFLRSLD